MNYDKTKYKVWTWKNPVIMHWIINPGLAFNELVLGHRIPKVTLIEKDPTKTLSENTFIPCPHCKTLHSGLKWTPQNKTAYKNWFGLYCDNCGKIIPCVTNLTSYLILGLTFPIWICYKNKWKAKWLETQRVKFSKLMDLTDPEPKSKWWLLGLLWGFFMYVFMTILFPIITVKEITQKELLINIPVWLIAGLLVGYITKVINGKKKRNKK